MIQRRRLLLLIGPAAMLMTAAAAGAQTEPRAILDRLIGTTWRAVTIAGQPVGPVTGMGPFGPVTRTITSTLRFRSASRVAGNSGCNNYSGALSLVGDQIRIGALLSTLRGCWPDVVLEQEERFRAALVAAQRVSFDGPFLVLHPAHQGPTTRLARVRRPNRGAGGAAAR
jgi:heat shock protein HslJ